MEIEKQRATQAEASRLGRQEEASLQRQGRQSALGSYSRLRVCDVDDFFADNFVHQSMMRQPSDSGSWTSRSDDARRDHLGLHSVAHANTSSIIPASNVHPGSWIQRSPSANGPHRDSVVHSVMEASPRLYKSWDGAQVPYNQQQTLVNPHAGAFLIILDPRPQSICSETTSFASVPLRNDFGALIFYKTSVNSCTSNPAPTDFFDLCCVPQSQRSLGIGLSSGSTPRSSNGHQRFSNGPPVIWPQKQERQGRDLPAMQGTAQRADATAQIAVSHSPQPHLSITCHCF